MEYFITIMYKNNITNKLFTHYKIHRFNRHLLYNYFKNYLIFNLKILGANL